MLVPSLGALLVIGGLLFMASQTILHGRLSESRRRARGTDVTLEPRERGGGFGLATTWPGLVLMVIGVGLLLSAAII